MDLKALLVAALAASIALSGCTSNDGPETITDSETDDAGIEPEPLFGPHSGLPLRRPEAYIPSLEEPPTWALGEWWTIEIQDGFVGNTHSITRIAAGKEGDDFLVGMPLQEFNDEVMVLHHPGFGLVQSDTLGFETHDFLFEPLQFPLEVGKTWDSLWQGANNVVTHIVTEVDPEALTATVQMSGGTGGSYTYDAEMGVISEFNVPGYESYRVTGHGFDYEGMVRVPYSHDMTMFHGRLGPVVPIVQSQGVATATTGSCPTTAIVPLCVDASIPLESFTIPEGYDRASFSLIIFELAPLFAGGFDPVGATSATGHGVYSITATAPDGQEFSALKLPNQGGHVISSHFHDSPGGEWDLRVVAAGPAQVFIEGITYTTFDVELPSGCVVVDGTVHDHGGECGGHVHNIQ